REEGDGLLDARERLDLLVEVEARAALQDGAEPLDELRHRREPERHVVQRDLRRLLREQPDHVREALGLLRGERDLHPRRERRRAEPEEALAFGLEPVAEPLGGVLHPAVLGEAPCELLGGRLGLELRELRSLLREEAARLQLEERRDEDEELAARLEVELLAVVQPLDEREHDAGDVDLRQVELVLQDERQQQVERALERVEVELPDDHPRSVPALPDAAPRDGHRRRLRRLGLAAQPPPAAGLRRARPLPGPRLLRRAAQELPPDEERARGGEDDDRDPEVRPLAPEMAGRVDAERLLEDPERRVPHDVEREERR